MVSMRQSAAFSHVHPGLEAAADFARGVLL
jgi:hypothetical protein